MKLLLNHIKQDLSDLATDNDLTPRDRVRQLLEITKTAVEHARDIIHNTLTDSSDQTNQ